MATVIVDPEMAEQVLPFEKGEPRKGAVVVEDGFDPRTRQKKYKRVYPSIFNEDGTPYFNSEEDQQERAMEAMRAATVRAAVGEKKVYERARELLEGMTPSQVTAVIESIPYGEQHIWVQAEADGEARAEVLDRFGYKKPKE